MDEDLLEQIQHFFVSYNEMEGREFKVLRLASAAAAKKLIREGFTCFKKEGLPDQ